VKTPVLGDRIYGPEKLNNKFRVERQLLHAHHLSFTHPLTGKPVKVTAPIPEDFQKFFKNLD
jgi:23S rRNA-/tRNA-specific pseudouridylate synthase